jgi:hypothetical protein
MAYRNTALEPSLGIAAPPLAAYVCGDRALECAVMAVKNESEYVQREGDKAHIVAAESFADQEHLRLTAKRWIGRVRESASEVASRYVIALAGIYFVYQGFEKFWK